MRSQIGSIQSRFALMEEFRLTSMKIMCVFSWQKLPVHVGGLSRPVKSQECWYCLQSCSNREFAKGNANVHPRRPTGNANVRPRCPTGNANAHATRPKGNANTVGCIRPRQETCHVRIAPIEGSLVMHHPSPGDMRHATKFTAFDRWW